MSVVRSSCCFFLEHEVPAQTKTSTHPQDRVPSSLRAVNDKPHLCRELVQDNGRLESAIGGRLNSKRSQAPNLRF